ncbi:N-formylglutamate amidohydrolase [Sphingomonas sp.]|uniref:N-formylglutamate amidohydrolase n=1 Tax=Sphingomonas sp. TaxID=28214 RepID=UPI001EB567D9|nr:N-formylglutamate amidohydrolase [Sphingomonas sp.]MBX3595122.1 N-formylglutamate amidohydrolase [Sphingomonas sp.]
MSLRRIDGGGDVLILCDHASNRVPDDIDLGIETALLDRHIAVDLGAADVTAALAGLLDAPAILAGVSRLVIDLNREPDHPGLIPIASDGHAVPGNAGASRGDRIARFYAPYHHAIAAQIRARRPGLVIAVHSFTPQLEQGQATARPWQVGLLYNRDGRAARIAIDALRDAGIRTGDNEPYSGRQLNVTMNRHAEANGIPYLAFEIRNDLIGEPLGVAHWAQLLARIANDVRNRLAQTRAVAT